MQSISHKKRWLVVAVLAFVALMGLVTGTVLAHEGRDVEGYNFVVGWVEEPAYEGLKNGVEIRVTKAASGSHGGHGEASEMVGVEGLGETLRVEVTHVATDASKVLSLYPTRGVPGRYTAVLIPTSPGVYQFSVRGTVEGTQIDESFLSKGGGGGFDDIRSAADLQFPETLPQIRELESAVRGALETAQRAQDTALAASQEDEDPVTALLIVAMALGAAGASLGAAGLVAAVRLSRRR